MRPDDLPEEFEIDLAPIWPEDDERLEPIFLAGPLWIDFEEFENPEPQLADAAFDTPALVEFDEVAQLDPERLEEDPGEPAPAQPQRASPTGIAGSLGVHVLTVAILLTWSSAPAEVAGGIPVQLVMEVAPEPDDTAPGQAALEATNQPQADNPPAKASAPPAATPPPPPQPKTAAATPKPSKPSPPPEPKAGQIAAVTSPPAPAMPAAPTAASAAPPPKTAASRPEPAGNPAAREAQAPGAGSGKGDYYNHLVTLTRSHFDVLPLSFLAGRRGHTMLSVVVFADGTIASIAVKRSSGYPDIDARIQQMVAAVGRFPPLPENLPRPSVELDFNLTFPDALQQ